MLQVGLCAGDLVMNPGVEQDEVGDAGIRSGVQVEQTGRRAVTKPEEGQALQWRRLPLQGIDGRANVRGGGFKADRITGAVPLTREVKAQGGVARIRQVTRKLYVHPVGASTVLRSAVDDDDTQTGGRHVLAG